jgi:hypothetical protein
LVPATSLRLPRSTSPQPPLGQSEALREFPTPQSGNGYASLPAQIRQVSSRLCFERRKTPVPYVYLSATLAGPAPSGSTDTSRLCQGRLPPSPAPPGSGCPQLRSPAATGTTVEVSHLHSINKHLTAHPPQARRQLDRPPQPRRQPNLDQPHRPPIPRRQPRPLTTSAAGHRPSVAAERITMPAVGHQGTSGRLPNRPRRQSRGRPAAVGDDTTIGLRTHGHRNPGNRRRPRRVGCDGSRSGIGPAMKSSTNALTSVPAAGETNARKT